MAARKSPKSKAKRRPRHDGGLYEKQKKTRDPATGKTVSYRYWQASRDVAAENLPPGVGLDVGTVLAWGGGGIHCITQQVPAV